MKTPKCLFLFLDTKHLYEPLMSVTDNFWKYSKEGQGVKEDLLNPINYTLLNSTQFYSIQLTSAQFYSTILNDAQLNSIKLNYT